MLGRLIQDSILIAHEAFHFLKHKKQGRKGYVALKLDFNKAYDQIQWDFLQALLLKMGFHAQWVHLIMECVSTVNFSVFANGEHRTSFTPAYGLRQDDAILFFTAERSDCQGILRLLKVYSSTSSQILNFDKSDALFSANTPPCRR